MTETASRRKRPAKGGVCVYDSRPARSVQRDGADTDDHASGPSEAQASTPVDNASNAAHTTTNLSVPSVSVRAGSTNASSPASHGSSWDAEAAKARIQQLEEQLSQATRKPEESDTSAGTVVEATVSRLAGIYHLQKEPLVAGQKSAITRNVVHKNRLFGQSHWSTGVSGFRDIFVMIDPLAHDDDCKVVSNLIKCKRLAGKIKAHRRASRFVAADMNLPPREVADQLVNCYMRTCEKFYRILHIPTFRAAYEAWWSMEYEPDTAFLVQIKLILAIGAVTYDETFTMRDSAVKWTYEAQSWLAEPKFKSRLNYQSLQTDLLLLLAQELVGPDEDSVWISIGALLRKAMYMGLHRDPSHLPKMSVFAAEMRRRIWNTIMEIILQSSMSSGCPPMISCDDFDTEPPANFDDDQLTAAGPVSRPEKMFTQTSVAIALRKSFHLRLQIAKSLNDLGTKLDFEQALQIDKDLREIFKSSRTNLQHGAVIAGLSPFQFDLGVVDLITYRYLAALHIPFSTLAVDDAKFAFSRRAVTENALKIWHAAYPPDSIKALRARHNPAPDTPARDDLARFIYCSSGFFRLVALQASYLILLEVRTQVREERGLGHLALRPDLLAVLDDAKKWSMQYIRAGETNIKGYLVLSLVTAQIDGLMQGLEDAEFPALLVRTAEEAEETCLALLEEEANRYQADVPQDGFESLVSMSPLDVLGDLDIDMTAGFWDI